jgi:magnesium transporter
MQNIIRSRPESNFDWIDIVNPTPEELDAVAAKYGLHPSAVQDCLQPEHLPKYELIDDTHFIIARYFDVESAKSSDNIHELSRKVAIFFSRNYVITVHRKQFAQYSDLIQRNVTFGHTIDVVCKIVKASFVTYEEPIAKLDNEIDFYESRIFLKKRIPDLLKNIYLIKRKAYVIRKLFNLSKEIVDNVNSIEKRGPVKKDLEDYYVKYDTQIEQVYESINGLMHIYISLSSQRTNEVMRTLTVFTAFFLPLTFVVGVYGMNFHFMPELTYSWGYPAVMLFMGIITLAIYAWFKKKGWM